jgi:hypothetical protein
MAKREMESCHYDNGVFFPGCLEGAVYGKRRCVCGKTKKPPPQSVDRMDEIEELTQ